ncbi:hypothetical protein, conserved [Eimeria tenella]|uniref:Uncharacterized protein n=1 Tax=Eimeria tenella TaxID=5802 RepID=U6KXI6_EIMTE|nr:hypothetical protein, conserved [Eimeria tenella]CDJ41039.1 hypothetical protein, conserved [Eimeria tenella]|eukprot:XP_013231789.1 hypothetical protein, conserved [Eimeria tenella]
MEEPLNAFARGSSWLSSVLGPYDVVQQQQQQQQQPAAAAAATAATATAAAADPASPWLLCREALLSTNYRDPVVLLSLVADALKGRMAPAAKTQQQQQQRKQQQQQQRQQQQQQQGKVKAT